MTAFLTGKTKIYIGGVRQAVQRGELAAADFEDETWTEIIGAESIGTFGETREVVVHNSLGQDRPLKLPGTEDPGNVEVVCGFNSADAGQIALMAARKGRQNRAFRIVFDDAPAGGTPSERLFVALVATTTDQPDTVNAVTKLNATLALNSNIVRVAAAEAETP